MNDQLTVKDLFRALSTLMLQGCGDKKIIIADDNEGNSYHGMYSSCVNYPDVIKKLVEASNGLYDSQEQDYNNLVILG